METMSPAPKKRRVAAAEAAAASAANDDDAPAPSALDFSPKDGSGAKGAADGAEDSADDLLARHAAALASLRSDVAEIEKLGGDDPARTAESVISSSLSLSTLRSLRRRLALAAEARADLARLGRGESESMGLALENSTYEANHLRDEISNSRSWRPVELERMAADELGITLDDDGNVNVIDADRAEELGVVDAEGVVDAYLLGCPEAQSSGRSHRDASEREGILQKLRDDTETRSSLLEELSKSKLQLRELQRRRDELRGFLRKIPRKLGEIERAGEQLDKFFYSDGGGGGGSEGVWRDVLSSNDDGGDEVMGGTGAGESVDDRLLAANALACRTSKSRSERFRLARSNLPPPLYALFVQLAGYVDAWSTLEKLGDNNDGRGAAEGFVGAAGMDARAAETDGEWRVVLRLSTSSVLPSEAVALLGGGNGGGRGRGGSSSGNKGRIEISFHFDKGMGVILASAETPGGKNGDGTGGGSDGLLDDLFPGDDGAVSPNASLALLRANDGDGGNDRSGGSGDSRRDIKKGKPYYWCQALGGLDFPPPPPCLPAGEEAGGGDDDGDHEEEDDDDDSPFPIQACTRAVLRRILRRARGRATLAAICDHLGRRTDRSNQPLPVHPAMTARGGDDGEDVADPSRPQVKARLHSWSEETSGADDGGDGGGEATGKRYVATIKRKSAALRATVTIDPRSYPASPPAWSLRIPEGGGVGDAPPSESPLFDAELARIEERVNADPDLFANPAVEETFDWTLMHQLADLVSCWDEVAGAAEGGGGSRKGDAAGDSSGGGAAARARRGRDRRMTGFGERSPFWWYRNGL